MVFRIINKNPDLKVDEARPLPDGSIVELNREPRIVRIFKPLKLKGEKSGEPLNTNSDMLGTADKGGQKMAMSLSRTWNPVLGPIGRAMGFDDEFVRRGSPELTAALIELPVNILMPKLGQKIFSLLAGVGGLVYAKHVMSEDRESYGDFLQLGLHFFNDLVDPDWDDIESLLNDVNKLKKGFAEGKGLESVWKSLFLTKEDIQGRIDRVGGIWTSITEDINSGGNDGTDTEDDIYGELDESYDEPVEEEDTGVMNEEPEEEESSKKWRKLSA